MLLKAGAIATALLLGGCPLFTGQELCRVGDPELEPSLEIVVRQADGTMRTLDDGGEIPMTAPPQGGYIAAIGVRVDNAELCDAEVQIALIDPCTQRVIALERRTVSFKLGDDGWAQPAQPSELSDYANVAACPSAAPAHDVDGNLAIVEARLYEPSGRVTTRRINATPTCAGDTWCECNCDVAYNTGGNCEEDLDGGLSCGEVPMPDAGP